MTDYNDIDTEAGVVAELAKSATANRYVVIDGDKDLRAVVRDRDEVVDVRSFEQYRDNPRRPRGTISVHDAESFATVIGARDQGETTVYANVDHRARFTAILNDNGWRDHRVVFEPITSRQFDAWIAYDRKFVNQAAFAEFLEERAIDVIEPSSADLIAIARTFKAKRNVTFEAGHRLQSGDVRLTYNEETGASAGSKGNIEIPETFKIGIPVYRGTNRVEVTASLRYDIGREGLQIGYRLLFIDDIREAVFEQIRQGIVERTAGNVDHIAGAAPGAVEAFV